MADTAQIANRHIAIWNETNPARRESPLDEHGNAGATYIDPVMSSQGWPKIGSLIGAVHARFTGFRFTLAGTADGYDDNARFSWALGPEGEPDMILGTDFAIVKNGRLKSVTGFIDKAPA